MPFDFKVSKNDTKLIPFYYYGYYATRPLHFVFCRLHPFSSPDTTPVFWSYPWDQITIKTPNPKGRLFLKIDLQWNLAAGFYLSEAPSLLIHTVQYKFMPLYLFTHEKGRRGEDNQVRRALVHKRGRKYQHDRLYLQSINSIKHQ